MDKSFDTIVIGSRGLGVVSRFLQGSVSQHVATHADATVVISRWEGESGAASAGTPAATCSYARAMSSKRWPSRRRLVR